MTGVVVGIDFGTTATCVAVAESNGDGRGVVRLEQFGSAGNRMPSCVFASGDALVAGSLAANQAIADLANFEATPKRALARGERVLALRRPVKVVDAVAAVLATATEALRAAALPEVVVATHPAAWGDTQTSLLVAAVLATGLPEPRLVAEPVAAAWQVVDEGERRAGGRYAIFDWGGGTFDAAVVAFTGERFELAGPPRGEDPLGGEDVDELLLHHVLEQVPAEERDRFMHPGGPRETKAARGLRADVRLVKETLSRIESSSLLVGDQTITLTRAELDELTRPLVERCVGAFQECLSAAGVTNDTLTGAWLVGDSSRLPLVAPAVEAALGRHAPIAPDAKAVVALGATQASKGTQTPAAPPPPPPPPPPEVVGALWHSRVQVSVSAVSALVQRMGVANAIPSVDIRTVAHGPDGPAGPSVVLIEEPGPLAIGDAAAIGRDPIAYFAGVLDFHVEHAEIIDAFGAPAWLARGPNELRLFASASELSRTLFVTSLTPAEAQLVVEETVRQAPRSLSLLRLGFAVDPWIPARLDTRVAKIDATWKVGDAPVAWVVVTEQTDRSGSPSLNELLDEMIAETRREAEGLVVHQVMSGRLFGGSTGQLAVMSVGQVGLIHGYTRLDDHVLSVQVARATAQAGRFRKAPTVWEQCSPLLEYALLER